MSLTEFTSAADPGILDIRSGPDYTELYVDARPLGLTWSVNEGSTIDRLIRYAHPDGDRRLGDFRTALAACNDDNAIISLMAPLLAAGRYRLVPVDFYSVEECLPLAPTVIGAAVSFYGGGFSLITTVADANLDRATVEKYRIGILAGERPRAIALCCYDSHFQQPRSAFVLDGHHKLRAYSECRIRPHVLLIARIDSPVPRKEFPREYTSMRCPVP